MAQQCNSPVGITLQDQSPGNLLLVMDLSKPLGVSVKDGIDSQLCSSHITVDEVERMVAQLESGVFLADVDIGPAHPNPSR